MRKGYEIKYGDWILKEFEATKPIQDIIFLKRNMFVAKEANERGQGKKRRKGFNHYA